MDTSKIGMYQSPMLLDDLWNYLEVKEATLTMYRVEWLRKSHQFWALKSVIEEWRNVYLNPANIKYLSFATKCHCFSSVLLEIRSHHRVLLVASISGMESTVHSIVFLPANKCTDSLVLGGPLLRNFTGICVTTRITSGHRNFSWLMLSLNIVNSARKVRAEGTK